MSPLANMLVQIKNAQAVGHGEVAVPFSQLKFDIATLLQKEGYLGAVEKLQKKLKRAEVAYLRIMLKPDAIRGARLVSKPSRRVYSGAVKLQKVRSGFGAYVVSTSKGIMTGDDARKANIGGEVLFEIW